MAGLLPCASAFGVPATGDAGRGSPIPRFRFPAHVAVGNVRFSQVHSSLAEHTLGIPRGRALPGISYTGIHTRLWSPWRPNGCRSRPERVDRV